MQWKNEFEDLEKVATNAKISQRTLRDVSVLMEQAKQNIRNIAFSIIKPKHRCIYVQRHQQVLVRMWDLVYEREAIRCSLLAVSTEKSQVTGSMSQRKEEVTGRMPQVTGNGKEKAAEDAVLTLHTCFEELHEFLQNDFADCFDLAMKVPVGYLEKVQEGFKIDINGILAMAMRVRAPKKLMLVIADPYKAIIDARPTEWNYQKIRWLKRFVAIAEERMPLRHPSFVRTGADTKNKQFYTPLIKQLIYYDFNSIDFKNWLINAIYEDVDEPDSIYKKLERLSYHLNELGKLPVKEGSSYSLIARSVKDDVCSVISKELKHLEDKHHLPLLSAVRLKENKKAQVTDLRLHGQDTDLRLHEMDTSFDGAQDRRRTQSLNENAPELQTQESGESGLYFGMSVTELGVLIALLQKNGIIRNQNMRQVATFLSKHCHSIGRDQFAEKNLYNAFSERNKKTLESLDSKLMDVVNLLRKWKRR